MTRPTPTSWLLPTVLLAVVAAVACGGGGGEAPGSGDAEARDASPSESAGADVYTVRGLIEQLPDPDREGSELMVRHEPIPSFKNSKGETVGMGAMTMPFPLASGVSLDGFEVDDKVELTFEVQFEPSTSFETTKITKLPDATEIGVSGGEGAHSHGDHDHGDHDHGDHSHDM